MYTYYQNNHVIVKAPTHYKTHTYKHPRDTHNIRVSEPHKKHYNFYSY